MPVVLVLLNSNLNHVLQLGNINPRILQVSLVWRFIIIIITLYFQTPKQLTLLMHRVTLKTLYKVFFNFCYFFMFYLKPQ
jgi:hypothetical protein